MVCLQPQSLIRCGEILIGFEVIGNWDIELKEMNKDKVGLGVVSSSSTFLLLLGYAKVISFAIQANRGITQGHTKWKVPSIPYYTTINIRINRQDIKIENDNKIKEFKDEYIIIAIDSTGIKVTNRGQWWKR
jgi:hypothetical protein